MYQPDKIFPLPESLPAETVRGFTPDLKGLIAWLETQEPGTTYCVTDEGACLFGRFHKALNIPIVAYFDDFAGPGSGLCARYPRAFKIAATGDRTFGAALERARSALRDGG